MSSALGSFAKSILSGVLAKATNGISISGNLTVHPDYCVQIQSARDGGLLSIMAPLPESFSTDTSSDYDSPFTDGLAKFVSNLSRGWLSDDRVALGMRMMGASTSTQAMTMQIWQGSAPMEFSIPMHFVLNTDAETDILMPLRQLMSLTLPSTATQFSDLGSKVNLDFTSGGTGGFLVSPGPKLELKNGYTPKDVLYRVTGGASDVYDTVSDVYDTAQNDGLGAAYDQVINGVSNAWDKFTGGGVDGALDSLMGFDLFSIVNIKDNISLQIGNFMRFPSVVITNVSSEHGIKLDAYTHKPIEISVTVTFRTFLTPKADDLSSIIF